MRRFFPVILLLLVWLAMDTCVYIFLDWFGGKRMLFYDATLPTTRQIEGFSDKYFHPELGWDMRKTERDELGARRSHVRSRTDTFRIKFYGDSYTFGYGLAENETFPYMIEERTGWKCLNYGVNAYGTDQAFLKYLACEIPSEFSVLGITDENIGRCVTVWWSFYRTSGFTGTKPRFTIDSGRIQLAGNPISSRDDIAKLLQRDFVESLRELDYWTGYYEEINAPRSLRWPATITIIPHADFFAKHTWALVSQRLSTSYEKEVELKKYFHLFDRDSEGFKILTHIVSEFVAAAESRNEKPIILLLPTREALELTWKYGRNPSHTLVEYLDQNEIPFVDMARHFQEDSFSTYFQGGVGHFTGGGTEEIANRLVEVISLYE